MDAYREFIYKRTYSRWDYKNNRRENWEETVDRYINFFKDKFKNHINTEKINSHLDIARLYIKDFSVMPSMRSLWSAGEALKRENVAGYNCAYTTISSIKDFADIMYILMCGTGIGFSVERQYINKLPVIADEFKQINKTIVFEDSKLGWAKGFLEWLNHLWKGEIPAYDLSKIRPKGAVLKTFGGRASGSEPLKSLLDFTLQVIRGNAGKQLSSVNIADIVCKIADIVVVGGVRRSATICLTNPSDRKMAHYKDGEYWLQYPYRALANISLVYTEKPTMNEFIEDWLALYKSGTGERGIINRQAFQEKAKTLGREVKEFGVNPCQPAFATVVTPDGIRRFGDIKVGDVIWSGKQWTKVVNKFHTGVKPVYEYITSAGTFIGTKEHRIVQEGVKVEVGQAHSIDVSVVDHNYADMQIDYQAVIDGLLIGDGFYHKASKKPFLCVGKNDVIAYLTDQQIKSRIISKRQYGNKLLFEFDTSLTQDDFKKLPKRTIPEKYFTAPANVVASFLRGLFSANGSVIGDRITIKQTSWEMIKQIQQMLSLLGIKSYITTNTQKTTTFKNGQYTSKESYNLNITTGRDLFAKYIGFIHPYKQIKLDKLENKKSSEAKQTYEILEVNYLGDFDVYDITVEADEHTYWSGGLLVSNCGEIVLRDKQFCNLTEVVLRPYDTEKSIKNKIKNAVFLGVLQSTLTDFNFISKDYKKNCEEERLLGVSLTGIADIMRFNDFKTISINKLKEEAKKWAKEFANLLCINTPKAVTTVKPSGTVSQLAGSSSGIHPAYADYYIRRVRISTSDPLFHFLVSKGFKWKPEVGQDVNTCSVAVLEFPQKAPSKNSIKRHEINAIQQCELVKKFYYGWCDHNVSCTVYVKDDEWLQVGAWVYENLDKIGGMSFLPYDNGVYELAPYEEITEEEYNKLVNSMPKDIDYSELNKFEEKDYTQGAKEYACSGGACEL